jgi:hypothetical protein
MVFKVIDGVGHGNISSSQVFWDEINEFLKLRND